LYAPFTALYPPAAAHAIKNIASGAPSPAGRRPCDQKHRIGRIFAGGPPPMRSKTSHRAHLRRRAAAHAIKNIASAHLRRRAAAHAIKNIASGVSSPAGRRRNDCDAYMGILFAYVVVVF